MKIYLAGLAALALLSAPAFAPDDRWDARVAAVSGDAAVRPADGSPEVSAEEDMPLEEGDLIVVGEGGSAEVALDGGSLITVRENSEFVVEKTARGESSFFLKAGSLLAKIQKLASSRFSVRTPTAVAAVRGTEFGVETDGEETHIGVFDEGKVEVTGQDGGSELLISNQETAVGRGKRPVAAYQLKRFVARRQLMRGHARRISQIRGRWKALPPEARLEKRRKAVERMREHRKKMLEKRREQMNKRQERRQGAVHEKAKEHQRKMDERRRRINQRRGQ
jgi:hypothetical protein